MSLEIVWRNAQALAQAKLRITEATNMYYGWAEQARNIRANRADWDPNKTEGGLNDDADNLSALSAS